MAKQIMLDNDVLSELAVIKGSFPIVVKSIKALEARLSLVEAMEIVEKLQRELTLEPFATKLNEQLEKNPGFKVMHEISKILRGSTVAFTGSNSELPAIFINAPIVNVDCERSFSIMKNVNAPNRLSMTDKHVKDTMVVQWNEGLL